MDDTRLREIRERHGRATKGPWREYMGWVHPNFAGPSPQTTNGDTAICEPLGPDAIFNRAFIAASWQDVKDLLEEVERLREFAADVAMQMAVPVTKGGREALTAGGLSVAEEAFEIVGWSDPHFPTGGDHAE